MAENFTVGVADSSGAIFTTLKATKVTGGPVCTLLPSPLENGIDSIDNVVNNPCSLYVEAYARLGAGVISTLAEAMYSKSLDSLFTVVQKNMTYTNMMLVKMDMEDSADNGEYSLVRLNFQQVMFDDDSAGTGDNSNTSGG